MKKSNKNDTFYKIFKEFNNFNYHSRIRRSDGSLVFSLSDLDDLMVPFFKSYHLSKNPDDELEYLVNRSVSEAKSELSEKEFNIFLVRTSKDLIRYSVKSFNKFSDIYFKNESSKFFDQLLFELLTPSDSDDNFSNIDLFLCKCSPNVLTRYNGRAMSSFIETANLKLIKVALRYVSSLKDKRNLPWLDKLAHKLYFVRDAGRSKEAIEIYNEMIDMEIGFNNRNIKDLLDYLPFESTHRFIEKYKSSTLENETTLQDAINAASYFLIQSKSNSQEEKFSKFKLFNKESLRTNVVFTNCVHSTILNSVFTFQEKLEEILKEFNKTPDETINLLNSFENAILPSVKIKTCIQMVEAYKKRISMEDIISTIDAEKRRMVV